MRLYVTALPHESQAVISISLSLLLLLSLAYQSTTSLLSRFRNNGTEDNHHRLILELFMSLENPICFFFFFNLQSEAEKKILTEEELERKKKKDDKVWLFSPILIEIFSQLRYWIVMQCSHSDNYGFDHSKKSEFDEKIDR